MNANANDATSAGDWSGAKVAPRHKGAPLVGILPEIRKDVLGTLRKLVAEHREVAGFMFGPRLAHMALHPDAVKRVLQDNVTNYTKDHFSYAMLRWLIPDSLLTADGETWLRQRRLAQPAFHRQRIAQMSAGMAEAAREVAAQWSERASRGESVDVPSEMMRLTLTIVSRALFSTGVSESEVRAVDVSFGTINHQLTERLRRLQVLPPVLPTRADREWRVSKRALYEVVDAIIARRRAEGRDRGDLLSMLMLAQDEETGERMNDTQLRGEVLTMLIAGHETTATLLGWTWTMLAKHPEVEAKLHAELEAQLGGRDPSMEDLAKLPYARMILEETMRLYPPVIVLGRKVVKDDVVMGYRIPKGTWMDVSPFATHRHPDFWPDPERFDPERFNAEQSKGRPRYAYFPFSGGPRQCIGNTFALVEAQLVLCTLAQRFRLSLPKGAVVGHESLITLRPVLPPMSLEARSGRLSNGTSPA